MSTDPWAQEQVTRLSHRVVALERQMQAVLERLDLDAGAAGATGQYGFDSPADASTEEVLALLREGKMIQAIKTYRAQTGMGLAGAKEEVERLKAEHGL